MCKMALDVYAELIFTPMSIYNCDRSPKMDVTVVVSYDYSLQMFIKIQHPNGW